jgi:hypothetical protein
MSNIVEVVEKEVSLPYLVNSFDMNVIIISLNNSACVISNTFDKDGKRLYEKQFIVEGAEYDAWGSDFMKNEFILKQFFQPADPTMRGGITSLIDTANANPDEITNDRNGNGIIPFDE